nr:hypothetical protein [Angustibacter aerolatus]
MPGRELDGVLQAMDFLPPANRAALGAQPEGQVTAEGKDVVIIGGGDTGADCLGTALRQGARSVTQARDHAAPAGGASWAPALADLPHDVPGGQRARGGWRPAVRREHPGARRRRHRAGRGAAAGRGRACATVGSSRSRGPSARSPRRLVLLAMGFTGPERDGVVAQAGVEARRARQRAPRRRLRHHAARGLRRRRRRARPVAHRVGDRRGAVVRRRGRPLPVRGHPAAEPDPAHRPAAHGLTAAHDDGCPRGGPRRPGARAGD